MEAGKIFCAFAPSHGVRNGGWLGLLCAVKTGRTVMLTSWLTLNPAGACLTSSQQASDFRLGRTSSQLQASFPHPSPPLANHRAVTASPQLVGVGSGPEALALLKKELGTLRHCPKNTYRIASVAVPVAPRGRSPGCVQR